MVPVIRAAHILRVGLTTITTYIAMNNRIAAIFIQSLLLLSGHLRRQLAESAPISRFFYHNTSYRMKSSLILPKKIGKKVKDQK